MPKQQKISPLYTDFYQPTMCNTYLKSRKSQQQACFDYVFRKSTYNGDYLIFAGLHDLIEIISGLRFEDSDIDYFKTAGFDDDFLNFLKK